MAENSSKNKHEKNRKNDYLIALCVGVAATLVALGVLASVGTVGGYEARSLLESTSPICRFLCSAAITASSTTLALMLTLIGTTSRSEAKLTRSFYLRARLISRCTALVIIISTLFLIVQCIPFSKGSDVPVWWYPALYYLFISIVALLSGLLSSTITLIYFAVDDLIQILGLAVTEHPFLDCD